MTEQIDKNYSSGTAWAGAIGALIAFATLNAFAMARAGGGYEYPLDDVYIHLAVAEQIAAGHYGVNSSEFASAASSPLYPLLLTPFAGSELQRLLPLIYNLISVAAAGTLFGALVARAGIGAIGVAFAALAPLAFNMYVSAYTGMENMAHGVASLMIVFGLWLWVEDRRMTWWLILGIFLSPALRPEGLALSMAAAGVVMITGAPRVGIALMGLGIAPLAAFSSFLVSMGLGPIPNSVTAKLAEGAVGNQGVIGKLVANLGTYGGNLLGWATLAVALAALVAALRSTDRALFGFAIAASSLAHLMLASIGWMDRYEIYILISLMATLPLLLMGLSRSLQIAALGLALAAGIATYLPHTIVRHSWNIAAMQLQQKEMGRLAKQSDIGNIAVNDLGHVTWQNPNYVLDLWGLASAEALETRLSEQAPDGWARDLTDDKDVSLIMIYDRWFENAVSPEWTRLGTLTTDVPLAFIGDYEVAFYASSSADVPKLTSAIMDWQQNLPERASFEFSGEVK
ncbi:MAG: hypothetical protein GKR98_01865 [Boseongicola sp.]|nr:MAG: hypothetical protein GKR98_01865 [Boseongicola sp.]